MNQTLETQMIIHLFEIEVYCITLTQVILFVIRRDIDLTLEF